jgi:hypothetical protein
MASFKRDISITLVVKLSLLFLLWFLFIKPLERKKVEPVGWMLSAKHTRTASVDKPVPAVNPAPSPVSLQPPLNKRANYPEVNYDSWS